MTQSELLDRLEFDLRKLLEVVRAQFVLIPPEALQVRPGQERWNALECFAHLNAHFDYFLPRIELAIHKARARSWAPAEERQQNWQGRMSIRAVDPLNMGKSRRKSPKRINPKHLKVRSNEVKAFLINSEMLLRLVQQAREVDLNRAKVAHFRWPHFNFLLGDLFEYIILPYFRPGFWFLSRTIGRDEKGTRCKSGAVPAAVSFVLPQAKNKSNKPLSRGLGTGRRFCRNEPEDLPTTTHSTGLRAKAELTVGSWQ